MALNFNSILLSTENKDTLVKFYSECERHDKLDIYFERLSENHVGPFLVANIFKEQAKKSIFIRFDQGVGNRIQLAYHLIDILNCLNEFFFFTGIFFVNFKQVQLGFNSVHSGHSIIIQLHSTVDQSQFNCTVHCVPQGAG